MNAKLIFAAGALATSVVCGSNAASAGTVYFVGTAIVSAVSPACSTYLVVGQRFSAKFLPPSVGTNGTSTYLNLYSDIAAVSFTLPNAKITTTAQNVNGSFMGTKPVSFTATLKATPAPAPTATTDFVTFTATFGNYIVPTCTVTAKIALVHG